MNIFVKIVPNLTEYSIMSLVHKLNDKDYLITDSDGEICGVGEIMKEYLNFS